ncbi:MAG: Gfo/Idh/MocA family oxidoreductase [Candidatus Pacebacteria bacterium]|nr:Gfo/Idh/MocA family oxidoreductase [Candidatus Paceibacterota bacterium]
MRQQRIGVIGWLLHFDSPYGVTVAACDTNKEKLSAFTAKHPAVSAHTDYREMREKADLDAVVISTPNWLHQEMAEYFLRQGIPVFLEKPMGVNKAEIDSLLRTQKETGVTCAIDFEMRVSPGIVRARDIIAAGEIGDVRGIEFVHHRGAWLARGNNVWRTNPELSGGLFFMEICHEVDIFRQFAGEITHVQSFSMPNVLPQYPDTMPDNVVTHLWFEQGRRGTILSTHTSSAHPAPPDRYDDLGHDMYIIVTGTEGAIRLECIRQKILVCKYTEYHPDADRGARVDFSRLEDYSSQKAFFHDISANHEAFFKSCALGEPHHQDLADAWKTHVACLAAERSAIENARRIEVKYEID